MIQKTNKSEHCTVQLPSKFGLALCVVKCGFVSEWVNRANLNFFISEIPSFGTAMVIQVFRLFTRYTGKNRAFFLFLVQKKHLLRHREDYWEAHCNANIHCSTQLLASFSNNKMLVFFNLCTFFENKMIISEHSHQ